MAREIHDGPLQDVTALLQQIHMSLEDDDARPRIERTEKLAKTIVRELRALCDELAPPWMDLGLAETLTELAERLSQSYDVEVIAELDELNELENFETSPELRLSFLRIFQEAVSNAVRHGQATEVVAKVYKDNLNNLVLEISDNGKGFDAKTANLTHEELRLQGHRGLANMTERMSLMGGSLNVISKPERGTKIIASVPQAAS
ncbi:MAG: ATP-binding protein [Synergistaceae bacterium]|nr:ATP-binding protein [Synergistaceae bacterium]